MADEIIPVEGENVVQVEETLEQKRERVIRENVDTPFKFLMPRDYQTLTLRGIDAELANCNDVIRAYTEKINEAKARIDVLEAKKAEIVTKVTAGLI